MKPIQKCFFLNIEQIGEDVKYVETPAFQCSDGSSFYFYEDACIYEKLITSLKCIESKYFETYSLSLKGYLVSNGIDNYHENIIDKFEHIRKDVVESFIVFLKNSENIAKISIVKEFINTGESFYLCPTFFREYRNRGISAEELTSSDIFDMIITGFKFGDKVSYLYFETFEKQIEALYELYVIVMKCICSKYNTMNSSDSKDLSLIIGSHITVPFSFIRKLKYILNACISEISYDPIPLPIMNTTFKYKGLL